MSNLTSKAVEGYNLTCAWNLIATKTLEPWVISSRSQNDKVEYLRFCVELLNPNLQIT
jgi:hypothetical protein